jgi:transmembrane sensor
LNTSSLTDCGTATTEQLQDEARDWLLLLTSGQATTADAQALRDWCAQSPAHAQAFEQAKSLWHALKPAAERLRYPRHFGRRAFLGGAVAASAAFFLVKATVPGGFSGLNADFTTAVGEQRGVDLAQGIRLELNTQTRISRLALADGTQGLRLISGEVEITTRADSILTVQAGAAVLSAQSARFNIRSVDQTLCVTCLDGSLTVDVQGQTTQLLKGSQLNLAGQRVAPVQTVDASNVTAWRNRMLVFNDASLASVIEEINRYRPGMLILLNDELGKRKVQARFTLDQLADVALLIRDAYGAKCTQLPGGVVLLS